jgi:phosphatidylethanolamine-binding protein (PEBP) family uncharacterized protein
MEPQDNAPESLSYTLLLVDPDAPTPDDPKFAYWRHWVVSGLKPSAGAEGKILTEYLGPGPKDEYASHLQLSYVQPCMRNYLDGPIC